MKVKKETNSPFARLGLSKELCSALQKRMGYRMPTPIQRKAIPHILEGSDVIAMAKTGSGKTIAFLAPLIDRLQSHSSSVGVRGIIISPTRELAAQTHQVTKKLIRITSLKLALLIGGSAMHEQFWQLSLNPDIILATPGRLAHHLVEIQGFSLQNVQVIIVDEADRLFELGFLEQLKKIWESLPPSRQNIFISATLPSQLIGFSKTGLSNPKFIRLDAEQSLSDLLTLEFIYIRESEKIPALLKVLDKSIKLKESSIIFVATRHHVEFISLILKKYGFNVSLIYGKMDYQGREHHLNEFRKKNTDILVVTDVAARGLDLPEVNRVINYDFPSSNKLFIHRSGRTARAGRSGLSTSFVTQSDLPYALELSLFLNRKIFSASDPNLCLSQSNDVSILGGLPPLSFETEFVNNLMNEDSEVASLFKSMSAAYNLYYKTRTAPSASSISRSKELLNTINGPWNLAESIHPSYQPQTSLEQHPYDKTQLTKLMENLRSFRPSLTKKGGKISPTIANQFQKYKHSRNILSQNSYIDASIDSSYNETSAEIQEIKPELKHLKKIIPKIPPGSNLNKNITKSNQFYLDISYTKKSQSEANAFALESAKLDLTPDDEGEMRRSEFRRRWSWNPTRKKYETTLVDHNGRVMRDSQGKKIRGDIESKGLYKKWATQSKVRIQRVGETENINPLAKPTKDKTNFKPEIYDETNPDESSGPTTFLQKKKLLEEEAKKGTLTNKQKRQLRKYQTPTNSTKPSQKHELKTAQQISKGRTQKQKLINKRKPKKSDSNSKKWERKLQKKIINKGSSNRSILIRRK